MNRCVVIGCGWAGQHHLEAVDASEYGNLVAAVDPSAERQTFVADKFGIPVYASVKALLASRTPFDTGIVATLPGLHARQCRELIGAGKNILCEKPVCRTSAEIASLQGEAETAGVRFGVVFNQRYGAAVRRAKELIDTEAGTLHLITASMYQHWPTKTGGHITDTFMITDACCHLLDIMTYLCGPVRQVKAIASKQESELYSDVAVSLLFENGCVGCMSHSNVGGKLDTQHPFQCVDVHTQNARYCIENQWDRLTVYPHGDMTRQVYETSVFQRRDYAVSMRLACEDYLRAVAEGKPLPADAAQALANMQVLETILDSIRK